MTIAIVILMLLGYLLICTEHITRINKATVALFCGVWGWVLYVCVGPYYIETLHEAGFQEFLGTKDYSIATVNEYIRQNVFASHIAQLTSIVMYLLTTMAIVDVLNNNGCFDLLAKLCRSRSSWVTVWMLALCSFGLSANLDNLTSAVVMLMVMNQLVVNHRQRMLLGAIIVIATNCGGCFTVIGDVTSLLVWTRGAVTPTNYTAALVLPALFATIIPTYLIGRKLPGHLDLKRSSIMYRGDDADVKLTEDAILFDNDTITDRYQHHGILSGAVHHQHLSRWNYDIDVSANNLLAFDTHADDGRATEQMQRYKQQARALAAHGASMAFFLSVDRLGELCRELEAGGCAPDTLLGAGLQTALCAFIYEVVALIFWLYESPAFSGTV